MGLNFYDYHDFQKNQGGGIKLWDTMYYIIYAKGCVSLWIFYLKLEPGICYILLTLGMAVKNVKTNGELPKRRKWYVIVLKPLWAQ